MAKTCLLATGLLAAALCAAMAREAVAEPLRKLEVIALLKLRNFTVLERSLATASQERGRIGVFFDYADPNLEADFAVWIAFSPNSAVPLLARGAYYQHLAWLQRGTRYAGETHRGQFAGFARFLQMADKDYRRAIALDPQSSEAYAALIEIAFVLGGRAQATSLLIEGLLDTDDSVPLHATYLWTLQEKWGGSWGLVSLYVRALGIFYGSDKRFRHLEGFFDDALAVELLREDQFELALEHIDRAIESYGSARRYKTRAQILFNLDRYEEGIAALDSAIESDPDSPEYHQLRALLLHYLYQPDEAYREIGIAIELDPYNPDFLLRRAGYLDGKTFKAQKDSRRPRPDAYDHQAGQDLHRALVYGSFDAEVHAAIARHRRSISREHGPVYRAWRRAIELMPHRPEYWLAYTSALTGADDCRAIEAAAAYRQVCQVNGPCESGLGTMAQVSRLASACEKPKVADGVELPLAPERPEEVAMLRRCGGLLREQGADAAIRACVELAEDGDVVAQADVGLLYVFSSTRMVSRNVEQPHMEQAAKWLQRAADKNDVEAATYLGQMYLNGLGVEQDTERALELLHAAAEQGSGQAYLGLGMAYDHGLNVEKDYARAERYYARAVELGNDMAVQHLADVRLKMNPTPPPPRQ